MRVPRLGAICAIVTLAGCAASRGAAPPAVASAGAPSLRASPTSGGPAKVEWPDPDPALLAAAGIDAAALRCNGDHAWGATLKQDARDGAAELIALVSPSLRPISPAEREALSGRLKEALFWRMVRAVLIEGDNNNLGALPLAGRSYTDDSSHVRPVVIFRSGFTPRPGEPGSCFASLLGAGGVRHVVNLFDGDIPAADLVAAERRAAAAAGASYHTATDAAGTDAGNDASGGGSAGYGPWRDTLRKAGDDPVKRADASRAVARLIREQILLPDGKPPRGNIHFHCGGGMHRSGMIAGVVERCVNHAPLDEVEAHYRRHVGWRDASRPGGFEEGNLRFIREFDCSLVGP